MSSQSQPQVLVLTSPVDPATDLVLRHLHADGVAYLRRDAAEFPVSLIFTGHLGARRAGWQVVIDDVCLDGWLRSTTGGRGGSCSTPLFRWR